MDELSGMENDNGFSLARALENLDRSFLEEFGYQDTTENGDYTTEEGEGD